MSKRYDVRTVTSPEFSLQAITKGEDGKSQEHFEPPFRPYCYVDANGDDAFIADLAEATSVVDCDVDKDDAPDGYWKVKASQPWDIRDFSDTFDYETYEADVRYTRRVMIDMGLQVNVPDIEDILYFDIEVDPRGEFPDPDEAKKQIISIAAVGGDGEEYFICHDSEEQILRDFKEVMEEYYIVTGWNSGTFDWPYIKARMQLMPFDIDYFSVVHFDLLYLMKHINREERESWALDDLGQDELDMEKTMSEEDHEEGYEVLWKWYQNDRETLKEYNIQDCAITAGLDDKYRLIQLIFRICRRGYCRPSEIMYRDNGGELNIAVGKAADSVVMHTSPDYVFNDKSKYRDISGFPGGAVFEPDEGVHFDVMTADFSGMYPAMIRDFNIGPNTWIDAESMEEAVREAKKQWPSEDIDRSDIIKGVKPIEGSSPAMARGFFIHPDIEKSVLARAVDELESLRMEFKTKKKNETQGTEEWHKFNNIDRGLKVLMNTIYGIAASTLHRYYIPGMSENVTELGQFLIRKCAEHGDNGMDMVNKTIYGDSVTGDTVTPIKDSRGHVELHRFDDLLDEYEFERIQCAGKDRYRPVETLYTYTRDGWNEVEQLVGHEVDKNVYRCRTPRGVFSVTEDHSVMSTDGEFSVSEWEDGALCRDTSPMPLMSHADVNLGSKQRIDVAEIADMTLYDDSVKRIDTTVTDSTITIQHLYDDTQKNRKLDRVGDVYRELVLPKYIELDETFGFVVGAFIGDGSTTDNGGAKLSVSDDSVRQKFYGAVTRVFGDEIVTDGVNISFANKILSDLFRTMCGSSSETKQLPDWYLDAPEEFLLGVLRGYAYADSAQKYRTDDIEQYRSYGHCGSQSRKLVSQIYFLVTGVFDVDQQCVQVDYRHSKEQYSIQWDGSRYKYDEGYHHRSKVRKKKIDCNYVWDLTVSEDHTFTDALGGTVLHNTDSVMFTLDRSYGEMDGYTDYVSEFREKILKNPEATDELDMDMEDLESAWKLIDVAKRASQELNEFIQNWCVEKHNSPGNYMEMDLDYVWRNYIVTHKKKKYAGEVVYGEGPASYRKVVGFKAVKANTSEVIADFQRDLIDALLQEEPTTPIIDKYHEGLFDGKYDEHLVKHTRLGKMPDEYQTLMAHARAAKMIIEREGDKGAVRTGDKIPHIKYANDTEAVQPTDNGIDDLRENQNYCPECEEVVSTHDGHQHEVMSGPHFRARHYSYLWDARFQPTMDLLGVARHDQTGLNDFITA